MWIYLAYRWPDEASWLAALAAEGWQGGAPPEVALLVTGALADAQDQPLPGWHVAAAFRDRAAPKAWAVMEIDPPEGMPVLGRAAIPASVSRFQARAALSLVGLLPAVDAAIASSGNVLAQLAWSDAQQFERASPTIAEMAGALGLSDAQIDDLFRRAARVVA